MKKPYLSIIIPVFNLWNLTRDCLESLAEKTVGSFYEVIVVDNGSSDATPDECPGFGASLWGDRFRYVRRDENLNFGPACNLGAQESAGEMLFFLNNDTLLTEGWVEPLLAIFKVDPKVVAASPLCLFPDSDRVQGLGIAFDGNLGVNHPYALFPGSHPVARRKRFLQALSAAAIMIPAHVFKELDGFFPEFINGFEDIDLCCRMRQRRGRLALVSKSVIYHLASQTPGRNKHDAENIALINQRCVGSFRPDLHKIAANDGFICELTPWMDMIMRDPDVARLSALDGLESVDEIVAALDEHPLWASGYDKLAGLYVDAGRADEAVDYLLYGATLCPDPERLKALAALAELHGFDDVVRHVRLRVGGIEARLADPADMVARAQGVLSWAADNNDPDLASIYQAWLTVQGG